MNKSKSINTFFLFFFASLILTSCGASSVGFLGFWIQTVDDNAYYVKTDKQGNAPEDLKKSDYDNDYDDENISIDSRVFFTGEKFRFEFPNLMHEIKEDPCHISISIENKMNNIDFIKITNAYVDMKEIGINLLENLEIGNEENDRNFDIWVHLTSDSGVKASSTITKQGHLDFKETKTYFFKQPEEITTESINICLPEITTNKTHMLKLTYNIEVQYLTGEKNIISVSNDYILKEETVKMYNPIFNK